MFFIIIDMNNKTLEQRSIDTYNTSLLKIKELGIDIDNFTVNGILVLFNEKKIPITSQNSYLTALIWYYKKNKKGEDIIKKLSESIKVMRSKINKTYNENKFSQKEIEKFANWNTIVKIYEDLKSKAVNSSDKRVHEDLLLISLYVLHPPRRADYSNMYIINKKIDIPAQKILWTSKVNIDKYNNLYEPNTKEEREDQVKSRTYKNYYIFNRNKGYFVFDDYKTFKIYGKQVIEVIPDLNGIIKNYIKINNLKNGDKLINLEYDNYMKRLNYIFESYIKKSISVSMLRHIFISHILNTNNPPNNNERLRISRLMAHSIITQSIYRKEELNVPEIEIDKKNYENIKKYNKYETDEERKEARKAAKRRWYYEHKKKQDNKN